VTAEPPYPWLFATDGGSRVVTINIKTGATVADVLADPTVVPRGPVTSASYSITVRVTADGDPASDVLYFADYFVSYEETSKPVISKLQHATDVARAQGRPIKVAAIWTKYDMGAVPQLFNKPVTYAKFLAAEAGFVVESHPEPTCWPGDPFETLSTTWHRLVWQSLHDCFQESYRRAQDRDAYLRIARQARRAKGPARDPLRLPTAGAGTDSAGGGTHPEAL